MSRQSERLPWNLTVYLDSELLGAIPELKILQDRVEHNDWHNDDVLQQSLRLFDWMKRLPASLPEVIRIAEDRLQVLLTTVVDPQSSHHSLQALLGFAALIHDVGKAETFQRQPDGSTQCPGHEAVSAQMAGDICARFDFSPVETHFITTLVRAHGEPYALFKKIATLSLSRQKKYVRGFETTYADHLSPLLLLAAGDMMTSHLESIRPEKYRAVFDFYQHWLQNIWSGKTTRRGKIGTD